MALLAQGRSNLESSVAFAQHGYSLAINFDQLYEAAVGQWKVGIAANASSATAVDSKLASAVETKENFLIWNAWSEHASEFVYEPSSRDDVDAIGKTVERVMSLVEALGPNALNLSAVKSTAIHPEHMVAVLRSTFLWKEEIPGW